jgi:hypothetical protein
MLTDDTHVSLSSQFVNFVTRRDPSERLTVSWPLKNPL